MKYGVMFIDGGFRPAIVKEGRKWNQAVIQDGTKVRVRKIRKDLRLRPIAHYTQQQLARRMLRRKNCLGVKRKFTKAARLILNEAKSQTNSGS
jgi:hypothetical protein